MLLTSAALGLDSLMHYYQQQLTDAEQQLLGAFEAALPTGTRLLPYIASAGPELLPILGKDERQGITVTASGFYSPQGRQVRAKATNPQLMEVLQQFEFNGQRITNLEMETAGIYGLAAALGHQAVSCNVILANRARHIFSKQPAAIMDYYIQYLLDKIAGNL